jgi:hypothetical protein
LLKQTVGARHADVINRSQEIIGSLLHLRKRPETAERESIAETKVEFALQYVEEFLRKIYTKYPSGDWMYIEDDGTLPIGVPVPWSSHGRYSKMKKSHRNVVRRLFEIHASTRPLAPLFFWHTDRRWHVDLGRYPTVEKAVGWIQLVPFDAARWIEIEKELKPAKRVKRST